MNLTAAIRLAWPSSNRSLSSSSLYVALITGPLVIFLDPSSPHLCLLKLRFVRHSRPLLVTEKINSSSENSQPSPKKKKKKSISQLLFLLETWQGMERTAFSKSSLLPLAPAVLRRIC